MKKLPISAPAFLYVEHGFKEWLETLGYSETTVTGLPNQVREFLYYLEQRNIVQIRDIDIPTIETYYHTTLKCRPHTAKSGGLSNSYLNKHIQALMLFVKYLRNSGRLILPALHIYSEDVGIELPPVLTEQEVRELYEATEHYPQINGRKPDWFYPAMALRDKVMLTLFYACGLRRNEGLSLNIHDIFWDKQFLFVKKGKGYKERFVPISPQGLQHLERYVSDARPYLLKYQREEAVLISERGRRMKPVTANFRFRLLIARTGNTDLQAKAPGLHTLRHSIATHLCTAGMQLEQIKDFLGHSSLESTQIYTHILETTHE